MSKKAKNKDIYSFDDSRKMKDGVLIKRLFKYVKPYWWYFLIIVPTVFISSFFIAYLSTLFGNIMDMLSEGKTFNEILNVGYFIIG